MKYLFIKRIILLALLLPSLFSNTIIAQGCDCENISVVKTIANSVSFNCQIMTSFPPNPVSISCIFTDQYSYDLTTFTCGTNTYFEVSNWAWVGSSQNCVGMPPISLFLPPYTSSCYPPDPKAWFLANGFNPSQPCNANGPSLDAGCYTLISVIWPLGTECPGQQIGENSSGPIYGTLYPPHTMYIPCESFGCCSTTIDCESGYISKDPSGASCGLIDLTKIKWVTPCGTFLGTPDTVFEPCEPRCGDVTVNKMVSASKKIAPSPTKRSFTKSASIDNDKPLYSVYLKNEGKTLSLSSVTDVKQINIFDILGRKSTEIKTINGTDFDFGNYGTGVYLIQIIKSDNTVLPAMRIQK